MGASPSVRKREEKQQKEEDETGGEWNPTRVTAVVNHWCHEQSVGDFKEWMPLPMSPVQTHIIRYVCGMSVTINVDIVYRPQSDQSPERVISVVPTKAFVKLKPDSAQLCPTDTIESSDQICTEMLFAYSAAIDSSADAELQATVAAINEMEKEGAGFERYNDDDDEEKAATTGGMLRRRLSQSHSSGHLSDSSSFGSELEGHIKIGALILERSDGIDLDSTGVGAEGISTAAYDRRSGCEYCDCRCHRRSTKCSSIDALVFNGGGEATPGECTLVADCGKAEGSTRQLHCDKCKEGFVEEDDYGYGCGGQSDSGGFESDFDTEANGVHSADDLLFTTTSDRREESLKPLTLMGFATVEEKSVTSSSFLKAVKGAAADSGFTALASVGSSSNTPWLPLDPRLKRESAKLKSAMKSEQTEDQSPEESTEVLDECITLMGMPFIPVISKST